MKELEMYDVEKVAGGDLLGTAASSASGLIPILNHDVGVIATDAINILDNNVLGVL